VHRAVIKWSRYGSIETLNTSREGVWKGGITLLSRLGGLRSVVSSPSGVRGEVAAENGLGAFWARKNASGDNEFGIGIRPIGLCISFVYMWRYIKFKAGQNRDEVRNSGQLSVPGDLVIFSGQAAKIRDCQCPGKIGTDGHLSLLLWTFSRRSWLEATPTAGLTVIFKTAAEWCCLCFYLHYSHDEKFI